MVLYSDMDVYCWSGGHVTWSLLVALPSIVIYTVIFPGLALKHMRGYFADGVQVEEDEEALRLWGPMINMYSDEHYWWSLMTMERKIIAAALTSVLRPSGIVMQALTVLFVFGVFLALELFLHPYRTLFLGSLELAAMAIFMITVYLAILMSQDVGGTGKETLGMLIVLINVIALVGVLSLLIRELYPRIVAAMNKRQHQNEAQVEPGTDGDVIEIEMNDSKEQLGANEAVMPVSHLPEKRSERKSRSRAYKSRGSLHSSHGRIQAPLNQSERDLGVVEI